MDAVLFQEKMNERHREYLCRMLKVKELPEDLLERYAQVKRLVDRIDGHLTPGDLAMIIVSIGVYRASDGEIYTNSIPAAAIDAQDAVDELPVTPPLDESDDKVIEEAVEPPDKVINSSEIKAETIPAAPMLWSPGMPVNVLQDEELKKGKIFAVHPADDDTPVQLTVEFEGGETVTVNEDEVEAV